MLQPPQKNFRQSFPLEFTKELIRNTNAYKELRIKKEVKEVVSEKPEDKRIMQIIPQKVLLKKRILKGAVRKKIRKESKRMKKSSRILSQLKEGDILPEFKKYSLKRPFSSKTYSPLYIPKSELPETVRYLKPIITSKTIDIGKLNPLLKDPLVRAIECHGSNKKIIVIGGMGRKNTNIILNKEEVKGVIKKFSEIAKIPVNEGVFRVVLGNLLFSAIVSEITDSKFLIKKLIGIR